LLQISRRSAISLSNPCQLATRSSENTSGLNGKVAELEALVGKFKLAYILFIGGKNSLLNTDNEKQAQRLNLY